MNTTIFRNSTSKGIHSFYLLIDNEEFYLFSQTYKKGVEEYFGKGVRIEESTNYSRAHNDWCVKKTMEKIPMYIRNIEKEYAIEVLKQTKKRSSQNYR